MGLRGSPELFCIAAASCTTYLTIECAVKACVSRTRRDQGDRMKKLIGVLALALVPTLAAAAEKPDWAFPVTEMVQPPPRFDATRVRPAPAGSTLSITRAKADDMYDIPNWFPNMYPPMPAIVQYGNKERQVRACRSCHLPTGTDAIPTTSFASSGTCRTASASARRRR